MTWGKIVRRMREMSAHVADLYLVPARFRLGPVAYRTWTDCHYRDDLRTPVEGRETPVDVLPDPRLLPEEVVVDLAGQDGGFDLVQLEELAGAAFRRADGVVLWPWHCRGRRPGHVGPC